MHTKFLLLLEVFFLFPVLIQAQKTVDDLAEKQPSSVPIITNNTPLSVAFSRSAPPPAPTASGDVLCAPGTATLNATPSAGGTINWYNVATAGTSLATGNTYSPSVATTTSFWAEEVVGGTAGGAQTISTPFNSNNGQRGCMFDITATNTITINQLSSNLYAGTTANYEIYYKAGTHVGFEANAGAWTLLGSTTGLTSAGNNVPTLIPITFSVNIPAGQTGAFYVTNDFGGGTSYTTGTTVGNLLASNADMEIYTATVRAPEYASTNTTTVSNASCTINESGVDWTYYYNNSNPEELLFAIAHDPNNLGNNSFTATASITVNNSPTTTAYQEENTVLQLARFMMGRYWNVDLNSGSIIDPVWIRFYYDPAERIAMVAQRNAWNGTHGGTNSPSYFFKTVGNSFDHNTSLHYQGVYNSIPLTNVIDNQTSANGKNYVEIRDVSSFSGGSLITGVVPVGGTTSANAILLETELLEFKVAPKESESILQWQTAQEKALSHFVVEHSLDGIHFDDIGIQTAQNNKSTTNTYQWTHTTPHTGSNYYRLKLVDIDGQFRYSELRTITHYHSNEPMVLTYPNPFREKIYTRVQVSTSTAATLSVANSLGQVIYTKKILLQEGNQQFSIDTHQWQAGCYHVSLKTAHFSKQQVIIKK